MARAPTVGEQTESYLMDALELLRGGTTAKVYLSASVTNERMCDGASIIRAQPFRDVLYHKKVVCPSVVYVRYPEWHGPGIDKEHLDATTPAGLTMLGYAQVVLLFEVQRLLSPGNVVQLALLRLYEPWNRIEDAPPGRSIQLRMPCVPVLRVVEVNRILGKVPVIQNMVVPTVSADHEHAGSGLYVVNEVAWRMKHSPLAGAADVPLWAHWRV
jgi:hypothetical protein